VKKFKGKVVVADFGARNIERLKIFLDIANETERKLAITLRMRIYCISSKMNLITLKAPIL